MTFAERGAPRYENCAALAVKDERALFHHEHYH